MRRIINEHRERGSNSRKHCIPTINTLTYSNAKILSIYELNATTFNNELQHKSSLRKLSAALIALSLALNLPYFHQVSVARNTCLQNEMLGMQITVRNNEQ